MGRCTAQGKRRWRCRSTSDDGDQARGKNPCTVWSSKNLEKSELMFNRSVDNKGETGNVNAGEVSDIKP